MYQAEEKQEKTKCVFQIEVETKAKDTEGILHEGYIYIEIANTKQCRNIKDIIAKAINAMKETEHKVTNKMKYKYLKGINFRENLFSRMNFLVISRELIFAKERISKISREQIFANEDISNISREFIFANDQNFFI